eukprot:TRINITY_DN3742_c1_g3_i1.p2 TRINITY_DN3742_c1_g3~~TRINITY_DN3742_c1_g3_i1.p2  ORF type:complete len:103 (+),score=13.63 TRINITY_DN3742_c1_g3_i1:198-506(+)
MISCYLAPSSTAKGSFGHRLDSVLDVAERQCSHRATFGRASETSGQLRSPHLVLPSKLAQSSSPWTMVRRDSKAAFSCRYSSSNTNSFATVTASTTSVLVCV